MFRFQLTLPCLLAGGMLWASAGLASAQSADPSGIIRITDSPEAAQEAANGNGKAACPNGEVCPPGVHYGHGHHYYHGHCHHHCSHTVHRMLDWLNPHGAGTRSPDHGWCPPAKRPIYRQDVVYQKMFPDAWTGMEAPEASGLPRPPVVYMPTDTTQLGYYSQKVPYWQPNQAMSPPAPVPSQWHVSLCDVDCRPHVAGAVFGTAPRVAPGAPAIDEHGVPVEPEKKVAPPPPEALRLERTPGSPNLIPIHR